MTANTTRRTPPELRFDRVAIRVIDNLQAFARSHVPDRACVLITLSAPIRQPSRTTTAICDRIEKLLALGPQVRTKKFEINSNQVRIRLIRNSKRGSPKLLGAVHNPTANMRPIFQFLESGLI